MAKAERNIPTGLYVHIPFCVKKCAYCDFLSFRATEETKNNYVDLLCEEIEREAVRYPNHRGTTVFFGGGTPTVLPPKQLERILWKLKKCFSVNLADMSRDKYVGDEEEPEITLECNPGTVTEEDLRRLRAAGFGRLSVGLQSARDEELRKLGRIHTWEEFLKTYDAARRAGFQNINVDIMSALPGQSVESYVNTIERAAALRPEHISAYSLIIEEGTPFYERYGEAEEQRKKDGEDKEHLLPTEEEERRMYELTEEILERKGYHRYEISNYALPGCECRHNMTYWRRGDYLGFGLGAASLMENRRFVKPGNLREYREVLQSGKKVRDGRKEREGGRDANPAGEKRNCSQDESLHQNVQQLSVQEQMEEFLFLGLRLTEGISAEEFEKCFDVPVGEIYGKVLKKLQSQGLLVQNGDRIFLTGRGLDVSNMVFAEFLL